MVTVAVLDDWQGVARGSADWSPLMARAKVVFFAERLRMKTMPLQSWQISTSFCRCASARRCRPRSSIACPSYGC